MEQRGQGPWLRALRRGAALGLALTAAWGVGMTADFGGLGDRAAALGEDPAVAAALRTAQLGELPGRTRGLEGWGRLLLSQSAVLSAGEEAVAERRAARDREQVPPEPEDNGDRDDQEEPDLRPQDGDDGVVEMTARGKEGGKYLYGEGVYLYDRTGLELEAAILSAGRVDVPLGEGPQILIVHTHGSEAYTQSDGDAYEESDPYRTTDCTHNVVRVGEEMATVFRAYGFQVVHDTTLFDYPAYNGAYDRSYAAVESWLERYPSICVVLDVHRDALLGAQGEVYKLVSREADRKVAQVMLVVGSDGAKLEHPRWKDNLAFAVRLQQGLTKGYRSLARPIVARAGRYNQQLCPGSLLVEVGGHGNTLTEAVDGARLWADNVARTLLTIKEDARGGP